jgi:elongation factor Ts
MAISAAAVKALRTQTGAGMMDCKRALVDADGDSASAIELLRARGLAKAGKRAGRATSEGVIGVARSGPAAAMVELGCETDFVARTDEYQTLAQEIAELVAGHSDLVDVEKTLAAPLGEDSVEARVQAAISTMGENIALKRVVRLVVPQGVSGGYVHAGGKLGVIVGVESDLSVLAAGGEVKLEALAKDLAMHVAAADPTPLSVDREGMAEDVIERERRVLRAQAEESGKPEGVIEKMVEGRLRKFFAENCLLEQAFVKDPDRSVGDVAKAAASEVGAPATVRDFARFRLGEESTG